MAQNVVVPPFDEAPVTVVGATPQSAFPFDFPFWDAADIRVLIDGSELGVGSYTVAGLYVQNGDPVEGGYGSGVVTLIAPVSNCSVTIDRFVVGSRESQFSRTSPLGMPALNADLNKQVARNQDLSRRLASSEAALQAAIIAAGSSIGLIGKTDTDLANGVYTAPFAGAAALPLRTKLGQLLSVPDFRLVIDLDDTNAALRAMAVAQTNSDQRGRRIFFPAGSYRLSQTLAFTAYMLLHNVVVYGENGTSTFLDFSTAPAGSDGITFGPGGHFDVRDLTITNAPRDGISVNPGATPFGGAFAQQSTFDGLRVQFCGRDGIRGVNWFLPTFGRIWSRNNVGYGLNLIGGHTTVTSTRAFYCSDNVLGGAKLNGIVGSDIGITCDRNGGPGILATNFVGSRLFVYGEENVEALIKLRTSTASLTGLPDEYKDIKALNIEGCWSWANSYSTPGAFAGLIDAETADGREMDFRIVGNYDRAVPGSEAVHKSIVLNPANGEITTNELGNRLGGTVLYGASKGASDRSGYLRPVRIVPGDNPFPGSSFTLPSSSTLVFMEPAGTITYYTLVLPRYPKDGDKYAGFTTAQITNLTLDPTAGGNAPGRTTSAFASPGETLAANTGFEMCYLATINKWVRTR